VLLGDVFSNLVETYNCIDFRAIFVKDSTTQEKNFAFIKVYFSKESDNLNKNWSFFDNIKHPNIQFIHQLLSKDKMQDFFDGLIEGKIEFGEDIINFSQIEKDYLSKNIEHFVLDKDKLFVNRDEEYPHLLFRIDYDQTCNDILELYKIPKQLKGVNTLNLVESFLDVKGTSLINCRISIVLPIYCKLEKSENLYVLFHKNLVNDLEVRIINSDIKSVPINKIPSISEEDINKIKLDYDIQNNEKIEVYYEPLELVIIENTITNIIEKQVSPNIGNNDITNPLSLIRNGENQFVEFKRCLICKDELQSKGKGDKFNVMRAIDAFLNTNDGILFIGIDDNNKSQIIGIEKDFQLLHHDKKDQDGYETILRNCIKEHFQTNFVNSLVKISFHNLEKKVCIINVEKSTKPIFVFDKDNYQYFFIRQGNSVRKLEGIDLSNYLENYNKSNLIYDSFLD
jgi:hypothetical protein